MSNEFNEGDLVEAVKGESLVRGRLHHGTSPSTSEYLYLGHSEDLSWFECGGWTVTLIEKAAPKLPTAMYTAIRATLTKGTSRPVLFLYGEAWIDGTGNSVHANDIRSFEIVAEPVPVTAKRVLDDVIARTTMHCSACSGHLADIRKEYGVAL